MLTIDGNKIVLTRGDSACIELTIKDAEGNDYDYSGDTVVFGVKRSVNDKECVLTIPVTDNKITFTPEMTKNMQFGDYLYDVQLTHTEEAEEEGEEDVVSVYTVIAAAKFVVGYEIV